MDSQVQRFTCSARAGFIDNQHSSRGARPSRPNVSDCGITISRENERRRGGGHRAASAPIAGTQHVQIFRHAIRGMIRRVRNDANYQSGSNTFIMGTEIRVQAAFELRRLRHAKMSQVRLGHMCVLIAFDWVWCSTHAQLTAGTVGGMVYDILSCRLVPLQAFTTCQLSIRRLHMKVNRGKQVVPDVTIEHPVSPAP